MKTIPTTDSAISEYEVVLKDFSIKFGCPPYGRHQELPDQWQSILEERVMGQAYDRLAAGILREIGDVKVVDPIFRLEGIQLWP